MTSCVEVEELSHWYGKRTALDRVSFRVQEGEIFGFLGPNGGGKTTLFRVLSTFYPPLRGRVSILGHDLAAGYRQIRKSIGVVFQNPSTDKKLTVAENMRHQGHLYGFSGAELGRRIDFLLERTSLSDRRNDLVETLSGGLRRRVEIAKAILHKPQILLLDEPSTGLDPAARREIWNHLKELSLKDHVTILLTTHIMEEADGCGRLAFLNEGKMVALDSPKALKETIGGDVITLQTSDSRELAKTIQERFKISPQVVDGSVRLEMANAHTFIPQVVEAFPGAITGVSLGKPTLEDVFIRITGRKFNDER